MTSYFHCAFLPKCSGHSQRREGRSDTSICVYLQSLIIPPFDLGSKLVFFPRAWGPRVHHGGLLSWVSDLPSTHFTSLPGSWELGLTLGHDQKPSAGSALHSLPHPSCQEPGASPPSSSLPSSRVPGRELGFLLLPPGKGLACKCAGILSLPSVDSTPRPRPHPRCPSSRAGTSMCVPVSLLGAPGRLGQVPHTNFVLSSRIPSKWHRGELEKGTGKFRMNLLRVCPV